MIGAAIASGKEDMVFKIRPARQNVWAACVMLVLLGGGVADTTAAEEDCQLKRVASLDITDAEGGLVLGPFAESAAVDLGG